jgi:hypothetical protein
VANRAEFTETLFLKCGTEMGRDSKKYCSAVMHGCTFAGTEMRWDSKKYYFQQMERTNRAMLLQIQCSLFSGSYKNVTFSNQNFKCAEPFE